MRRRAVIAGVLLVLALSYGVYRWTWMRNPSISIFPTVVGTRWVYEWTSDFRNRTEVLTRELIEVDRDGAPLLAVMETFGSGLSHYYRYYDVDTRSATLVGSSQGKTPLEGFSAQTQAAHTPRRIRVGSTWSEGSLDYRAIEWAAVETRAGAFPKALVVEVTARGGDVGTEYYVDGIGLVMGDTEIMELVEYTPGK